MKLASFRHNGKESFGQVVGDGIVDLGDRLRHRYAGLRGLIAADALGEAAKATKGAAADYALSDISFLPTLPDPGKIICVGINYEAHRIETGRPKSDYPTLFVRFPESQVGHLEPMIKPKASERFDYEGELVVIIGKPGHQIEKKDAFAHIAGYSCYNDGSIRDWQGHSSQFTPGKNFYRSGAFGPWMVTPDEIPDAGKLTLSTRLNGEVMQHTSTSDLIFDIPTLLNYISAFTPLQPGDCIVTGTPGGVGARRTPPVWMKPGDTVEVEISGIGTLRNPIVGE